MNAPQKSLKKWTDQEWTTSDGSPSEGKKRYLPKKAWDSLSPAEKRATNAAKARGNAEGKQFVKQPEKVAKKVKPFRANEGGIAMKKKSGYAKGGYVKCGASNPATQKGTPKK